MPLGERKMSRLDRLVVELETRVERAGGLNPMEYRQELRMFEKDAASSKKPQQFPSEMVRKFDRVQEEATGTTAIFSSRRPGTEDEEEIEEEEEEESPRSVDDKGDSPRLFSAASEDLEKLTAKFDRKVHCDDFFALLHAAKSRKVNVREGVRIRRRRGGSLVPGSGKSLVLTGRPLAEMLLSCCET